MKISHIIISSKWIFFPFLIFFLAIFISSPCLSQTTDESSDQLWKVGDQRWTVEEESQYAKWVDDNITEDFFIRYKIPTDCADVLYAIRWIYARIAHLPAAATTANGKLIGHWSTDWKHLPTHAEWDKDIRFRAALLHILSGTWTGTLPNDTYPIRISPDSVTPGTLLFMTKSHSVIIGHICLDGSQAHPLQTWESVLPVKVRKLALREFFSPKPEAKTHSGLVKFRWPILESGKWKYLPAKEHPFYSEEQYSPGFYNGCTDFVEAVARRIDPAIHPPMEKMAKVIKTTTDFLTDRIPIVLAGYQQCGRGGCQEGSDLWEVHNTISRDGMIVLLMDHLSRIIESNHLGKEMVKKMMEAIPIDISKNRTITFYDVYQNCPWLSPYPGDSIEARWGLNKCEMIHEQIRNAKNTIAFIEKIYRKRDPKYADFSIQQQEEILRRLNVEGTKSECSFVASAHSRNQAAADGLLETRIFRVNP